MNVDISWKDASDIYHNLLVGSAALVGGWWAWSRYCRERSDESALNIGVAHKCMPHGAEYVVFIDAELSNRGKTKLQAKVKPDKGLAFDDGTEKLRFSCGLQLKRVGSWQAGQPCHLDWFESPLLKPAVDASPEINLLSEYEDPTRGNQVDFWMEPGETYYLGSAIVLPAGNYVAKVTFLGEKAVTDFWSRVYCFNVPS